MGGLAIEGVIESVIESTCTGDLGNRGVATSMIARLEQPRSDFSAAPQLFKCKTTIRSWRGFLCRAIIEVATPRLDWGLRKRTKLDAG